MIAADTTAFLLGLLLVFGFALILLLIAMWLDL